MERLINSYIAALLLALMLTSCDEPQWEDFFLRADEMSYDGRYHYSLDFSDSTAVYDVYFYTKYSTEPGVSSFPLTVRWISPSGHMLSERVYMATDAQKVLYRKDICPDEPGMWEISVLPGKNDEMLGLGVISQKHDGTR